MIQEETKPKAEFSGPPGSAEDNPLTELLNPKPLVDMSDEELTAHLAKMRLTMESPQSLKKAMTGEGKVSKPKAAKASKMLGDLQKLLKGLD
jgi:hypothetical protein